MGAKEGGREGEMKQCTNISFHLDTLKVIKSR